MNFYRNPNNLIKRKFLISPYMFCLVCFGFLLFAGAEIINIWLYTENIKLYPLNPETRDGYGALYAMLTISVAVLIELGLFIAQFEAFGVMYITDDGLVFRAPFHRTRKLYYKDIKYIGIDYGKLSLTKQFWIYFSLDRIPQKYYHKINRMRQTKRTMRVQYNEKVFKSLIQHLPKPLNKKLEASYSILRLYHAEND